MKLLIITSAIFVFAGFCESCSLTSDYKPKSIAELTKLAPLVLHAKVVDLTRNRNEYNAYATLNVIHVYKGKLNKTQIVAAGFGSEASCQSEVSVGDEKIFFLDVNPFRTRNDDVSSAVATNSTETFQGILEGLCCPYTPGWPSYQLSSVTRCWSAEFTKALLKFY